MKRLALVFAFIFILSSIILAQTIIENPEKSLSKNEGRELKLKEVIRIIDTGKDFYFRYPSGLKISPDGSIFVKDDEQLLKFNSKGNFIRNLFKKGQGPGEMEYISNYCFTEKNIIIHSVRPPKILWLNFNGELVKEFRIYQKVMSLRFLLFNKDIYYFRSYEMPKWPANPAIVDWPQNIISFSPIEEEIKKMKSFPIKTYAKGSGGGGGITSLSSLITIPYQNRFLFLSHTQGYLVKMYDLETNQIVRTFRRKYKRVIKPPTSEKERKGGVIIRGKPLIPPQQKYLNDIRLLSIHKDMLWVMTSTTDKEKGILMDVFNQEGKYIDNFYLKLNGSLLAVYGEYIFVREKDEEENIQLVKYKIVDETQIP